MGVRGFLHYFFLTWCLNTVLGSFRGGREFCFTVLCLGLWETDGSVTCRVPSILLLASCRVGRWVFVFHLICKRSRGWVALHCNLGASRASKWMDYHGTKLSSGFQSLCSHLSKNMLQSPEAAVTFHTFIPPVRKPRPGIKDFAMNVICQRATQWPKSQGILFLHSRSFYSTVLSLKHTCTLVQEATTDLSSPLAYASIHACEHSDCLSVIVCVCASMFSMWVCECACFCTCMSACVFWVWKEKK